MVADYPQDGTHETQVPAHILASYGVASAHPVQLDEEWSGGWRCDRAVLSPADEPARAAWIAKVMAKVRPAGVTVSRPISSSDGRFSVSGWRARTFMSGDRAPRFDEMAAAALRLNEALRGIPWPAVMDENPLRDPFAAADTATFAEDPTVHITEVLGADSIPSAGQAEALAKAMSLVGLRKELGAPDQVVHGDVAGCVIFDGAADPVITDFVPAHHPAGWSVALLIVDCMAWGNAPDALLQRWGHVPDFNQLALRAAMYRLFAHAMLGDQANPQALPGLLRVADVVAAKIEQT
ncbi:TIGR02569 family protein [Corynebacterium auriscanis]|uniref:TIGR02569 family protein n=1 Tax=Corynebacterium auriscanis TaxID=99807 RepID=UPI0024AD9CB6|nr:TIGR02569 family protein [Corynebacterium auriscanis]